MGGEELIILLHDCTLPDAMEVAEKVRQLVADTTFVEMPDGSNVTISFGVTEVKRNDDADSIVGRADKAVYEAKQQGRNRVRAAG
jgi:diguanylate cyclase (GGDEF)-like protein